MPAPRTTATLPALFVTSVIERAAERGADRSALLAASGASAEALRAPEAPVPIVHVFAVWDAAMRAIRDPAFPIAYARTFAIEHYPVLGFAVMTAPTGGEAIARVIRFGGLLTTSGRWSLEERGDTVRLSWIRQGARPLGVRVANESAIAEFLHATRQVLGADIRVLAASFRHAAPPDVRAHDTHFGVRVRWGADEEGIVFTRAVIDAIPRLANPALSAYFEERARSVLAVAHDDETLAQRVARVVAEDLDASEPSILRAAKRLATSERTLRRGLASEGLSFRTLVEDVRRARAEALLAEGRTSLVEIAFSLGFSELSSFSRAFKRWTGSTPREARRDATRSPTQGT
jgi:AraC-like DNA-binding protein